MYEPLLFTSSTNKMTDKVESDQVHTKDLESIQGLDDEAAIALKKIATTDMAPITELENHKVLRKIDWWLMPIVQAQKITN
jgi:hypothetical protein